MEMVPAVKKLWVAALDSDSFNQGHGYLKYKDTVGVTHHCCLGVLYEVMGVPSRDYQTSTDGRVVFCFNPPAMGDWSVMTTSLDYDTQVKLGLCETNFTGVDNTLVSTLIDLNDKYKLTFHQIAEWIRQTL